MTLRVDRPLAGPAAPPPCVAALAEIRAAAYEVASVIDGREVPTGRTMPIVLPHEHSVQLGQVHCASPEHVGAAIGPRPRPPTGGAGSTGKSALRRSPAQPTCSKPDRGGTGW